MKVITRAKALSRALFRASVLTMIAAGAAFPLLADEVSGDDAMIAVAGWVRVKAALGEDFTAQPASVREYTGQDGKGKFYVVSLEGGGFVVTSGDTELEPVIAYSKTGMWVDDVTQNPLLAMLPIDVAAASSTTAGSAVDDGNGQAARSTSGRRLAAAPSGKAAKWAELMSAAKGGTRLQAGRITSNPGDVRVGKLLTTAWSQGHHSYPRVAYNYYTPTVDTDTNYRFVCGCVATAGGQIMYCTTTSGRSPASPCSRTTRTTSTRRSSATRSRWAVRITNHGTACRSAERTTGATWALPLPPRTNRPSASCCATLESPFT